MNHIKSTILIDIRECIANLDSLEFPLSRYKANVNRYYLRFMEEIAIPFVGKSQFYEYVQRFCHNLISSGKLSVEGLNSTIVCKHLLGQDKIHDFYQRYPTLHEIVTDSIKQVKNRVGFISLGNRIEQKLTEINKMNEMQVVECTKELIENEFHSKQRRLTKTAFLSVICDVADDSIGTKYFEKFKHRSAVLLVIEEEIEKQKSIFISKNTLELNSSEDVWTLYLLNGLSLHSKVFDFREIHSQLNKEVKMYVKHNYVYEKIDALNHDCFNMVRGLRIIQDKFRVKSLSDIKKTHISYMIQFFEHETDFSVLTMKNTISALSKIATFLIELDHYKHSPKENLFRMVKIHNAQSMAKNTSFIPDEVIHQINLHLDELSETHRLIYRIFSFTGLRAKEVLHLEKSCSEVSPEYQDYARLKYIPHKILYAKRQRGLVDYNYLYIPIELHKEIQRFCQNNPFCIESEFLFAQSRSYGVTIPMSAGFCRAINRLIKKYEISDSEGNLWHFTAKQIRKTIAVNLIEDNATPQEVSNQLGHLEVETTEKYYIEVKLKKLAELNTEFFNKKFEVSVGEDNLKLYSEEERRQLYVDFCLNQREVEFGHCTKHISEGECGKRVGASSCAVCNKLCTGQRYLDKWEELRNSQLQIVEELHLIYKENDITEYEEFIEYKRETFLLARYNSVIDEIKRSS